MKRLIVVAAALALSAVGLLAPSSALATAGLTGSPNPSVLGQLVTFTAIFTSTGTTITSGTVQFTDVGGAVLCGSATVDSSTGAAICSTASLSIGSHTIEAQFSGSADVNPQSLTQVVNPALTVVSVAPTGPSNNPSPTVSGTASPGVSVTVYTDSGCAIPATAPAGFTNPVTADATTGAWSVHVNAPANTTTTFYAKANAAGLSVCSATFATYLHDSLLPTVSNLSIQPPMFAATIFQSAVKDTDLLTVTGTVSGTGTTPSITTAFLRYCNDVGCVDETVFGITLTGTAVGGSATVHTSIAPASSLTNVSSVRLVLTVADAAGNVALPALSNFLAVDNAAPLLAAVGIPPRAIDTNVGGVVNVTIVSDDPSRLSTVSQVCFLSMAGGPCGSIGPVAPSHSLTVLVTIPSHTSVGTYPVSVYSLTDGAGNLNTSLSLPGAASMPSLRVVDPMVLYLAPANTVKAAGSNVNLEVHLNTGDPAIKLDAVDLTVNPSLLKRGGTTPFFDLSPGCLIPVFIFDQVFTAPTCPGTTGPGSAVRYAAGELTGQAPGADVLLARLVLQHKTASPVSGQPAQELVTVAFQQAHATSGGLDWPVTIQGADLTFVFTTMLSGQVSFEGVGTPGNPLWVQHLRVEVWPSGTFTGASEPLSGPPVGAIPIQVFDVFTDASGAFQVPAPAAAIYDLRVKANESLSRVATGLTTSTTSVTFTALPTGDITHDDKINIVDFSQLPASFGFCLGDATFNPSTDLDRNTCTTIQDFSLLAGNIFHLGPLPVNTPNPPLNV